MHGLAHQAAVSSAASRICTVSSNLYKVKPLDLPPNATTSIPMKEAR